MIGQSHDIIYAASTFDLTDVINYVVNKHRHQIRRDGSPYIQHLQNVGVLAHKIAEENADGAGTVICAAAGWLHDVMEDQAVDFEDVAAIASMEIAAIVSWLSNDKRLPEADRQELYCRRLEQAPARAQVVKLADIIDNGTDALKAAALADNNQAAVLPFFSTWANKASSQLQALTSLTKLHSYQRAYGLLEQIKIKW